MFSGDHYERVLRLEELARRHGGLLHRRDLHQLGLDRGAVRRRVEAGHWHRVGRHTLAVGTSQLSQEARLWQAVWESGSGARLDGAAALIAAGLKGYALSIIDIALPWGSTVRSLPGVRARRLREVPPSTNTGIARLRAPVATIRAAQLASSDRQAALLVCLSVQQRLVAPAQLKQAWDEVKYSNRRALLHAVVADVCDGVHSLGELDFAALCRRAGLPAPSRQVLKRGPRGRVYLDCFWPEANLVVEIDGGHHALALNPVDDALRQNELALSGALVVRIPVLGLRLDPDAFMAQVARAYHRG